MEEKYKQKEQKKTFSNNFSAEYWFLSGTIWLNLPREAIKGNEQISTLYDKGSNKTLN